MSNYEAQLCTCGRVHFVKTSVLYSPQIFSQGKELLTVCKNCGNTQSKKIIFNPESNSCSWCVKSFSNSEMVNPDCFYKLFISEGYPIPMMSGDYANNLRNGILIDERALVKEIGTSSLTSVDSMFSWGPGGIKFRDVKAINVDMKTLFCEFCSDELEALSQIWCRSFDWKGTPFETKSNC